TRGEASPVCPDPTGGAAQGASGDQNRAPTSERAPHLPVAGVDEPPDLALGGQIPWLSDVRCSPFPTRPAWWSSLEPSLSSTSRSSRPAAPIERFKKRAFWCRQWRATRAPQRSWRGESKRCTRACTAHCWHAKAPTTPI